MSPRPSAHSAFAVSSSFENGGAVGVPAIGTTPTTGTTPTAGTTVTGDPTVSEKP